MPSKKSRLSFYADENIAVQTVTHLKSKGISIIHAYDINFVNKKDELHFKKSKALNRVLLSLDRDFNRYKNTPLAVHPGIMLITSGSNTYEHINKILDKVFKYISHDFIKHSIVRVTMDKIVKEKNGKISEKNIGKNRKLL